MPDANGKFVGSGYRARQAAGWERCFGPRDEFAKIPGDCDKMDVPVPSPRRKEH